MITNESKSKRTFFGTVVSDKMDKTIVVETARTVKHPEFKKILRRVKKYKVHDEHNAAKAGDQIEFCECRPLSKTKYMKLVRVVSDHSFEQ